MADMSKESEVATMPPAKSEEDTPLEQDVQLSKSANDSGDEVSAIKIFL